MDLFELVNGKVVPSIHALRIEPFKSMWENDDSEDKTYCMKLFDYIEFTCSPKKSNPYFGYKDDEKIKRIKKAVFGSEDAETTLDLILACDKYIELLRENPSYDLLETSIESSQKIRNFLKTVSFESTTNSGGMKIKPKEVTASLLDIPDVVKKLEQARTDFLSGMMEGGNTRNQREIGAFED